MATEINVHPYCDICGNELTPAETDKNQEFENFEFPICDECFKDAMDKIEYIIEN